MDRQPTITLPNKLPPLRLVSRRTKEHVGACPFCGGDQRSDRFHVWMEPGHERYWCRSCDAKGPLTKLLGEEIRPRMGTSRRPSARHLSPPATQDRQEHYRQIYATIALWAHTILCDPANPEPLDYIRQRGIDRSTVSRHILGATLRDPQAIPELLRRDCPELIAYAEEAGVLVQDHAGDLRAHPNLCGALIFPYIADGEIVDLRARSYPGKGYKSLPGGYTDRGATFPFGWDDLDDADTIILTEGEFKALAVTQAYQAGQLSIPAMAHPGLSYIREEWANQLRSRGVRTIILAYDSGPRPIKDDLPQLAPEETWSIRHGQRLAEAGLEVRVLRLPIAPGQQKADLDAFLLDHSATRLQHLIDTAPTLRDFHRALPRNLLTAAKLPQLQTYPTRRARPKRLEESTSAPTATHRPTIRLSDVRAQIAVQVREHAQAGQGFLVLAHPPGSGKGHNTIAGLQSYLEGSDNEPGRIVWTALRKEQIRDQDGLELTPLHGRNPGNCRKFGEAQVLSAKGYSVRDTLCRRRCPYVDHCIYLRQFSQDAHFFAPMPLLQATGWWERAGVIVLDEFDPARLTRIVHLTSADLAAMGRTSTCPHTHVVLRWISLVLAGTTDRLLTGVMLLADLESTARAEGLSLDTILNTACANLPTDDEHSILPGLPQGAGLSAYEALPPNYLAILLQQIAHERRLHLTGIPFTSRIELSSGRLLLFLRIEHLIAQLANPEQPKIILDATVSDSLLRAIFPDAPIQIQRPDITSGAQVHQIITRDWAKSTLRGTRRTNWYAEVSAQIRPDRPTLVVCTQACVNDLRQFLTAHGHQQIEVAHYGALRGSNAYKGYDVILAQIYHPNLEAIVREGRALFAHDRDPLNEEIIATERILEDATGARWSVQVPIFADDRLTALLESRREAEMVQCALRGRPLDHPEAQITLLFGMPLPGLLPTTVREGNASPTSNIGRQEAARASIIEAAERLLTAGKRWFSIDDLAHASNVSYATVRKYWEYVAIRLRLRHGHQIRHDVCSSAEQQRSYRRKILIRRGRIVPPKKEPRQVAEPPPQASTSVKSLFLARNMIYVTRLFHRVTWPYRHAHRYRRRYHPCSTGPPD
ncbi:hypothetical protein K2Z83_14110 [Oscillochloris sp. ZM17-4]|uniref:hypothetical protein n=1 Tax=Oscillochloris sp. ZM17-4 TaxID=2866714 RepID=UPI001C7335BD|nr:hypothetical protein [Oscillochloris sp. ZM17-4]MBX0328809.1 hypothetical protein [Oscillochloris sp. ZM17-4]